MMAFKTLLAVLLLVMMGLFPVIEAKCEPGFQCWEPMDFKGFQEERTAKVRHNSNKGAFGHHDPMGRQTKLQRISRK